MSLADVSFPDWELVVVDQSQDHAARDVVNRWQARLPEVKYKHIEWRNASRARNWGAKEASAPVVAYIDDDCTVDSRWLGHVAAAFNRHPDCGMVFGSVKGVTVDPRQFFVPTWEFTSEQVLIGARAIIGFRGMGASMYVRRAALDQAGGFDPLLGPGAKFRSSQDDDLTYRVLAHGWPVIETPSISVCHHGARAYRDGTASRLSRNYHFGNGALHMKMVRCRRPAALSVAMHKLWHRVSNLRPFDAFTRRPTKFGALAYFVLGMAASFSAQVDQERLQYVERRHTDERMTEAVPTPSPDLHGAFVPNRVDVSPGHNQ